MKGEQFPHLIQLLPVMLRLDPFLSCNVESYLACKLTLNFSLTYSMFALVRLFLSVLLIECIQGYYRRALITNKLHVGERYDDFEIDSDNNKRSPALPVGQAIEALQRYNAECKVYSRVDIIFNTALMIDWLFL